MSTFGDIERTFADVYEYRWAIAAGVLVVFAAVVAFGYWQGWHLVLWRHRLLAGVISAPVLAVTIWLGWSLGSPLFTNVTVEEEFPFALNAIVPVDMEREDVEQIMAGLAKHDDAVTEAMPGGAAIAVGSAVATGVEDSMVILMTEADQAALHDGMEMVSEASKDQDLALVDKGVGMMKAALDDASAASDDQSDVARIKAGEFKDADGFHKGSGQATIYTGPDGSFLLRLENLMVTNGPALHVYLSQHEDPDNPGEVKNPGFFDLGDLKGNRGNQNYPIPTDVNIAEYNSVVIYCQPFEVVFSVATLLDVA